MNADASQRRIPLCHAAEPTTFIATELTKVIPAEPTTVIATKLITVIPAKARISQKQR